MVGADHLPKYPLQYHDHHLLLFFSLAGTNAVDFRLHGHVQLFLPLCFGGLLHAQVIEVLLHLAPLLLANGLSKSNKEEEREQEEEEEEEEEKEEEEEVKKKNK